MKARNLHLISTLLATLLFFTSLYSYSQTPKYIVGPGEYNCYILPTATHKLYDVAPGLPTLVSGQPSVVTSISSNLHHYCLLDDQGNVYCWGDNAYGEIGIGTTGGSVGTPSKITVDSLGNPFTNIVQTVAGGGAAGYASAALKSDGTVWVWGATSGGNRGNGTWGGTTTRPVQVPFPAGTVIKKILFYMIGMALDANGNVWTWGGNSGWSVPFMLGQGTATPDVTTPHIISLPSAAKDIVGGSLTNYALLANGQLWGWGYYGSYLGLGATASTGLSPVLMNSVLGFSQAITSIGVNNESAYVILADSTLWSWGDNVCGSIGNGLEPNYATYVNSSGVASPYAWDWGANEDIVPKPVQIAQGLHSFTNIWTTVSDVFYCYAEDVNGQLYSWGRNKYGVLGNGVMSASGDIGAIYPNSWDVPYITAINPFSLTKISSTSSPYCILNPSGSPCNEYAIPSVAAPTANAGPNQNVTTSTTTLNGSASTANSNTLINYYLWTQVSGPSTALITLPSGAVANVSNLVTGTYVFQLKVTDNNWRTATSTVTVVVNGSGTNKPPVAKPNSKITITLPVNSATLNGTASTDPDGTIAAYGWQQNSGPNSATIATSTAATTTVNGLVAGTYIFFLTVTDNQGATNTAPDTVVVNPANTTPPTVSAGSAQTITLPISTVTLTGTATGNNGATISSTTWTQSSGPSTATIVSVGNLITVVTGLVQGTYTFRLSGTDNNGLTASSTVTITVNAAAAAPPPTVSAGSAQTITLPANSVTLTGTATGNGGATIASTQWSQTAGPSTAVIGAAGSLSTTASNLVQGTYTFTIMATDNQGQTASSSVTITVNAAALVPPTVSAGSAQTITLPTNSVTLTGTATGNSGATIASTSWTQTSGPATSTIAAASSLSTTVSGLVQGSYTFLLTATDSKGQTSTSSVTVTVNAAALVPPTVSAGSAQTITLPTSSVTLTGTATGNSGATIASTSWTQTSGPATSTFATASGLSTTVSGLVQGAYTFTLTATDNQGQTASSSVTITVNAAPAVPPTVSAGSAQTITLPTNSVTLTGTATGNGGATISSTTWTETSGPSTATIGTASSLTTTVSNLVQGSYTFLLTAIDNQGQTATATVTVTVNSSAPPTTNTPPTVSAGSAQTITLPTNSATLTGTATGTNGATIVATQWSQIGGPSTATYSGGGASLTTTVSGLVQGVYVFLLNAQDNNGQTASAYVTVTVNPAALNPPTVSAGSAQTITLPANSVTLTGTATANGGATIAATQWTQIGGPATATISAATSLTTTVSGLVQGAYVFLLNAEDNNGQTASAYVTVTVNAAALNPPTVNAGSAQTITLPANSVTLTGTASANGGATLAATQWYQIGGPATATFSAAASLTTTVSNLVQGVYVFLLDAQDNNGQTASSYVTVTVNAAPVTTPPTVSAGSAQTITLPVNSVTLTGSAVGTGGAAIVVTQWTQLGGPATATIGGGGSSLTTTVSNLVQGVYVFLLDAQDNNGQTASSYVTVTVNPAASPITPPTVSAAGQSIQLPFSETTLTGTASGTNGATISSVQWSQVSGPMAANFRAPNSLVTNVYSLIAPGVYTFELTVTDSHGQVASTTVNVTVTAQPPLPTVSAGANQTIMLPVNSVTLTGTATAGSGATLASTAWTQLSGPAAAILSSPNSLTCGASSLLAGLYTFQLTATDNLGQISVATMTVLVNRPSANIPPVANPGGNQSFTLTGSDTTIRLDGSASFDPDGEIVSYDWYQLSGKGGVTIANSNTATPTLYGLQSGVYVFVLVVTDNLGATTQAEVTITINSVTSSATASTLIANAGKDTTIALPANVAQLNGSGSSDPGGTITAYQWTQVGGPEGMTLSTPSEAITQASNLQAGLYLFRLTVTDKAGDTASATVKVTVMSNTRTSKDTTNEQFFLYPNPAHDQTTLNMTGDGQGLVMLNLFDMNGKFIKALQFTKMPGTSSTTIDVSHLTAGMYIIRATYGNNQMVQIKLMKQ